MSSVSFFIYRYFEPIILEIVLGSAMSLFPELFSSSFFNITNGYTNLGTAMMGFMLLAFGIIHLGFFLFLSGKSFPEALQRKGLNYLLTGLLIGDILHIMILAGWVYIRFQTKDVLSPMYYSQFGITFFVMLGRIYVMSNAADFAAYIKGTKEK